MKTGGKRKNSKHLTEDSTQNLQIMPPERKRAKMENNNNCNYSEKKEEKLDLDEMGVGVLPVSDHEEGEEEEDASDAESCNQVSPDKSDESPIPESPCSSVKHSESVMITPPEQLMSVQNSRFRRSLKNRSKEDLFSKLSDEIILMIMQWLPQKCLSECVLVCQRWRRIAYDDSLWQRIDLTSSVLHPDHMAHVLQRNPVVLRMAQAEIMTPMFAEMAPSMEDFMTQLQYLDLSMALISTKDLAELLGKCQSLKKLSVEHCTTDTAVCSSIAANADLEVLNMSQCYQLSAAGLEEILINCSELVELNLAWTRLDSECIDIVCKLVNENIQKLNLSGGLKWMRDSHVAELVSRCTCLTELDLSDCTDLTEKCFESILKHLCDVVELSFSRCYSIVPVKYLKLASLKSLQYLNIFGLMHDSQMENFKEGIKTVLLNRHEFSTIARPTVGIRRSSIWGLQVRD